MVKVNGIAEEEQAREERIILGTRRGNTCALVYLHSVLGVVLGADVEHQTGEDRRYKSFLVPYGTFPLSR